MGYSVTSKAYRIWIPASQRIVESRDVVFHELPPDQNVAASQESPSWLSVDEDTVHVGSTALLPIPPISAVHLGPVGAININIPRPSETLSQHEIDSSPIAHNLVTSVSDHGDQRSTDEHTDIQVHVEAQEAVEPVGAPAPTLATSDNSLPPRMRNPIMRYGEWIYPTNRNSYACTAMFDDLPVEPETMRRPWLHQRKNSG